jgi:hypothetical protein
MKHDKVTYTDADVMEYFNTQEDNRLWVVGKHFGISELTVNSIINRNLKRNQVKR